MAEPAEMADQVTRQVTIAEAAGALGVSEHVIRRRIRTGEIAAERVERPQGFTYLVALPVTAPGGATSQVASPPDGAGSQVAPPRAGRRQEPDSVTVLRALELLAAKDAEIAVERERSARLEQERAELYGRLGYFQAQLEQAKDKILALEAPRAIDSGGESIAAPPTEKPGHDVLPGSDPSRRPWWAFWR